MRRAKIVCTLGPAVDSIEKMKALVDAGMNVARLNMSHGDYPDHERRLTLTREAATDAGRRIGVIADLQGPKIRLGRFETGPVELTNGDRFTITTEDVPGDQQRCSTTYSGLPGDVKAGDTLLIDDGRVGLQAVEVTGNDVVCEVTVGGTVSNNKGINLPGVAVSVPAMSEKDERDLRWALDRGIDMVALSFVRSAKDVERVHEIMDSVGRRLPVIAKIEKPQAVDNLDDILEAFDAVMVARGDLGVELPLEDVPLVQKRIVEKARVRAKPVIVATQMLESMISAPRPTRAEASDVANAVLDGADAVMLSGETSVGEYPIETVQTMGRILEAAEHQEARSLTATDWRPTSTGAVMTMAAEQIALAVGATAMIAFTRTGETARRLARLHVDIPTVAITPLHSTCQELTLSWGVQSILAPDFTNHEEVGRGVNRLVLDNKVVEAGERIVVLSGTPVGVPGTTNNIMVIRAGHKNYDASAD